MQGFILSLLMLAAAAAHAGAGLPGTAIDGVIVKFRADTARAAKSRLAPADIEDLGLAAGMQLSVARAMSGRAHVLRLPARLRPEQVAAIARRIARNPDVAYAVPNRRKFPHRLPNDELLAFQWNLTDPFAGINLPAAWDISTGLPGVVVAIADTGSRPHPDASRILPGYDFISDAFTAGDGDGRDPSPVDVGDGVTQADAQNHPDLTVGPSSWHGEFVGGIVGATSNNVTGITGVNWNSRLLHVRVLGKGGGEDADIIDGIRWAAGFPVPGVPDNPNPAQVINMSLGGDGPCGEAYQETFDALVAAGKIIVLSAGNDNADVSGSSPANCSGAIVAVAATGRTGAKASYSNFGTVPGAITVAAPGGDGIGSDRIISLSNIGSITPDSEIYAWKQGTSFSAPQVSGVVSLMLSVNPTLTPAQVVQILRDTARPFPTRTGNDCDPLRCGAGLVDAFKAVARAQQLPGALPIPAAGFWWNPNEGGRGFTIEALAGKVFMASFLYDSSGRTTWYGAGPGAMSGPAFAGVLTSYSGGQTLTGSYKAPVPLGPAGNVSISFTSASRAVMSWPGGILPLERYDFGPGGSGAAQAPGTPEAGWWWAPSEGGRGYTLEIQGGMLLLAGYMYDAQGNAVWYASGPAAMSNATTYQGTWRQYGNGQTLTGTWRLPLVENSNAGNVTIQFTSTASGTLTLPDGRQVAIERFRF